MRNFSQIVNSELTLLNILVCLAIWYTSIWFWHFSLIVAQVQICVASAAIWYQAIKWKTIPCLNTCLNYIDCRNDFGWHDSISLSNMYCSFLNEWTCILIQLLLLLFIIKHFCSSLINKLKKKYQLLSSKAYLSIKQKNIISTYYNLWQWINCSMSLDYIARFIGTFIK